MKKLLLKFTTLIMIFVLALSFAGCSLFDEGENGVQDGVNGDDITNQTPSVDTNNGNNGVINGEEVNVPSIDEITDKPSFGVADDERQEMKKTEVIAKVRGAVVAIKLESGLGSGVIVDMNLTNKDDTVVDGENEFYIMTCHHVIDSAGEITVYLPDAEMDNWGESDYDEDNYAFKGKIGGGNDSELAVTLIGGDQKSDIALLKLKVSNAEIAKKIVKVKFPPTEGYSMMVGEDVIAIGNPGGDLPGTVSVGTISYINRETTVGGVGDLSLIQINVDIYHGSSGGGLFNMYGELIGITNAGRDGTADAGGSVQSYSGLNFSIPYIVDAKNGADDYGFMNVAGQLLITKTQTNYGYVPGRASMFGFTSTQDLKTNEVKVSEVTNGSIAYGKLRVNDRILKVVKGDKTGLANVADITGNADVTAVFKTLKAGDKVSLLVYRPGTGNVEVEMTAVQYIFCNTGIYT